MMPNFARSLSINFSIIAAASDGGYGAAEQPPEDRPLPPALA